MASSVTVNGYTFTTSGSGRVIVNGPGVPSYGIDIGQLDALSERSFTSATSGPNTSQEANAALNAIGADPQLIGSIQSGLATPPASPPQPVDTATQTQEQNDSYKSEGGADDDSGSTSNTETGANNTADNTGAPNPPYAATNGIPPGFSNSGTTVAGKSGTSQSTVNNKSLPGKRLQNPLGNFSSYTYQISLYMITPDAYAAFIDSGRRNINAFQDVGGTGNGAFLIAQSGGINNQSQKRAPFFDQDFFIDNLRITQAINGKDTGAATNVTEMSFVITEPYGFSFLTRLRDAATQLATVSRSKNYKDIQNPSRQFFVLGIQFLGYNEDGSVISSKDITGVNSDPAGNANGVYSRYFDIMFTDVKFKLEGKAVTYHIKAASAPPFAGMGLKRGILWNGAEILASTVDEALQADDEMTLGILAKLNKDQQDLLKDNKIEIANHYSVVYLGESLQTVANASIVTPADLDKLKWKMKVQDTSQVNEAEAQKQTPDPNARRIKFDNGTPILQAIEQIIKQSSYMTDALTAVKTTEEEPNPQTDNEDEVVPASKKTLKWYNIGVETKSLGWDSLQGDFAYDIKYIIQPYETPVVVSSYANQTTKYYGPHKRYDYWFTGKNSEIIKYEQNMDNTFFNVTLDASGNPTSQGGTTDIPTTANIPQNMPRQGALNQGNEAQNSYMTSLFDPGAYATAKIQILGDPDFLMQTNPSSEASVYNQYYGTDGYTVSPNGGQVFIEINFKEPVDYNNNTGLYTINDNILFWKYPADIQADINSRGGGVSYMIITVVSTFSNGKFVQDIDANINTFGDPKGTGSTEANQGREPTTSTANSGNNRDGTGSTQSSTGTNTSSGSVAGFKQIDIPVGTQGGDVPLGTAVPTTLPSGQITVPTLTGNQVQDDDATPSVTTPQAANAEEQGGRDPLDF